jgi:cysteinyl-tRNA synthetase
MSTTTQADATTDRPPTGTPIRLYNTLTRRKEPLEPVIPGKVGIYLCGPTVYKPSHVGHMVGPVIFDTIKRYLVYCGYQVTWVVNITDVDDKLIAESNRRGIAMSAVAAEMTADYMANLEALGVDSIDHFPKATDNIDQIIAFIETLVERGFAYSVDGDVYFDVGKDTDYGKLSGRKLDTIQGEGGQAAAQKRHPADFTLWKSAKPEEPSWPSPWGPGRPGWHIECSAMSHSLLGETIDIHGGGLDLVFPHHENEIAQSECCHGQPMAKYWLHNGLMQASDEVGKVGGRQTQITTDDRQQQAATKISKSTGAEPFRELLTRHPAEAIRFFVLATHYRRPIDFSDERIDQVRTGLESFYRFFKRYERITGANFYDLPAPATRQAGHFEPDGDETLQQLAAHRSRFLDAMDDDFNTGAAIGELFELLRRLNKFCDDAGLDAAGQGAPALRDTLDQGAAVLRELAAILGLFRKLPEETSVGDETLVGQLLDLLIEIRSEARKKKDFATADQIRNGLQQLGVTLEDRAGGTEWTVD